MNLYDDPNKGFGSDLTRAPRLAAAVIPTNRGGYLSAARPAAPVRPTIPPEILALQQTDPAAFKQAFMAWRMSQGSPGGVRRGPSWGRPGAPTPAPNPTNNGGGGAGGNSWPPGPATPTGGFRFPNYSQQWSMNPDIFGRIYD